MRITHRAYSQWATFNLPASDLLPFFRQSDPVTPPFEVRPDHTYYHHPGIDAYFIVSHTEPTPAITAIFHPQPRRRQRPATFDSPLSEREWLKAELARLTALNNPALRQTIESLKNEIRALKSAARSYREHMEESLGSAS